MSEIDRPGTRAEHRKARSVEEAPIGIVISDATRPDNPLIYANPAFERVTGYPREDIIGRNCRFLQGPDTDPEAVAELREGIEAGETVSVELLNYRRDGESFWNEVTVAPMRDADGTITNFVGFQVDVTERKRAELHVRRHRNELEQLIGRMHGLMQDVTELLMRSVDRTTSERQICERITDADPYVYAAFGELDFARNEVTISTAVGRGADNVPGPFEMGGDHPLTVAVEERHLDIVTDETVVDAFGPGMEAIAVSPLVYGSRRYGVLILGTDDAAVFSGREPAVVEALGRTIAIAINAAESRRILAADNIVELELRSTDSELPFVGLAEQASATFEYEGAIGISADFPAMCFTTDVSIDRLSRASREMQADTTIHPIRTDGEPTLVAIEWHGHRFLDELVGRGGELVDLLVSDGVAEMRIEVRKPGDPRSLVEWLQDTYPSTELTVFRERERPPSTKSDFLDTVADRLTDRQRAALELAFTSGYYDTNRSVTGDQLAEIMGISRATYHQHLRAAERKVFSEILDE